MGKEIRMVYDEEADVLDVSIGEPESAVSKEVEDDFFLRVKPESGQVIGFSILNFRKWFKDAKDTKVLPVKADFAFL